MASEDTANGHAAGIVVDAMGKNRHGNARVNVPEEYAKAEWSVEDPPSASALKLLLLIIAACGDDLDGEKQFPMSLLREVPGLAHKDASFLEAELRQLMKATVRTSARLNFLMGNYERDSFGVIVSDAGLLRSGKGGPLAGFAVRFGETFKQMVRYGEHFAVLDSVAILAMRSRHSVLLYQYLSFAFRARFISSLELPVADVRRVFGLMREEYPLFGRLKEKVLVPACVEISQLTEFQVTATPMLERRKAVGVRFRWQRKSDAEPSPSGTGMADFTAVSHGEKKSKRGQSRPPKAVTSVLPPPSSDAAFLQFWEDAVKNAKVPLRMEAATARKLLQSGRVTRADLAAVGVGV
jgi:hypothetical protein